ncbi:MAG TPA: hypothetical protein VF752_16175 [Thermoleophilaceae bacterium]
MRKALPLIAVAVAALALAAPALAKEGVSLSSTPDGLAPGQDWNVRITPIFHDGGGPPSGPKGIAIQRGASGHWLRFPAHRVSGGDYEATVSFPREGRWTYKVTGFGLANQYFDPVVIERSVPVPAASHSDGGGGDGFPFAAVFGGLGGLLVLGLGAVAIRRVLVRPASS